LLSLKDLGIYKNYLKELYKIVRRPPKGGFPPRDIQKRKKMKERTTKKEIKKKDKKRR
jgi:hypothetical protein